MLMEMGLQGDEVPAEMIALITSSFFFFQVLENFVLHKYTQWSLKHEAQNDTTEVLQVC